ncbi:MAG: protein kinase [Anaerolineae bacterium]|nr:protein kinase [Anaerolineae bacterium]
MARKKLGKYEIVDRIGRGGMAEVYRGYHVALDRYVAIKLLHPFLADDPEFKDRFENEARNVAKLKHPNIVQVYDFEYDTDGDSYYMVMELINGPTLKDQLFEIASAHQNLSIAEAIRITKSSAEALDYAHQRNMIHRDVKPANLMLDEDHRVVLTDFGIAKIVTGAQFTASGGMVGTPAYMAPEQGLGEAGDERSDIYSLGVILYQMITGQLPYDAETPLAVILKHLNEPLISPSTIVPDLPEDLDSIICKALAKDVNNRYQSAAELVASLEQLDETGHRRPGYSGFLPADADAPFTPQRHPLTQSYAAAQTAVSDSSEAHVAELAGSGSHPTTNRLRLGYVALLIVILAGIAAGALMAFGNDNTLFGDLFGSEDNLSSADVTGTASALLAADSTPSDTPTLGPSTYTDTPQPTFTPTVPDTNAPTETDEPTITPSPVPSDTPLISDTPGITDTPRPTDTFSPTEVSASSDTVEPTVTGTPESALTSTPNLTITAAEAFFQTQAAASATPNMTQTIAACDFEYIVIEPQRHDNPPTINDAGDPRLVPFDRDFSFEIVLRNTGSCVWPDGSRLTYNAELTENPGSTVDLGPLRDVCSEADIRPGLNFAAQQQSNFYFEGAVDVTDETSPLVFTGTAPEVFGCYYSVWDLLYPDSDVVIGRPLLITIRVWGGR